MANNPATKSSYAKYTQASTGSQHVNITATRAEYVALYYKDVPQGRGKKGRGRTTRATNARTAHHVHLSNRLAAAAHTDAWHNKDRARGQR